MGHFVAIVDKWCRWIISLGSLGCWNPDCVYIQALLLERVGWDPSATGEAEGSHIRERTLKHCRVMNGTCVRSSPGGDRQHLCSALSQLLVLPRREGSMAQGERLSCSLPHGPWTEVGQQQQLQCSSWLLPLLSSEQAWWYPPAPSAEELQRSQRRYRSIHCFPRHTSQHQELTLEAV